MSARHVAVAKARFARRLIPAVLIAAGGMCVGVGDAAGQEAPKQPAKTVMKMEDLPPAVRLGARVLRFRRAVPISDTLVIVPDDASFAGAMGAWSGTLRFPVLIDDGTPEAAERIGLFVKAFKPAKVVSWKDPKGTVPADPEGRFKLIQRIAAHALGVSGADLDKPDALDTILTMMTADGTPPPGVVVVDTADSSWAAGLVLSAAHAQPLAQFRYPYGPIGSVPEKDADHIDELAIATAERLKLGWKELGDAIDAVSICANIPTKADTPKQGEFVALTDRVGRVTPERKVRWAWTSQIYSPTTSAGVYAAMCGVFLRPDSAWLFNGYETTKPWSDYAPKFAGDVFTKIGYKVTLTEHPDGTEKNFRAKARAGVDASVIFVTTKGNADFFNLQPGQCKQGDVPILNRASAVYFIHSWSMTGPASRDTVGGRWIDRGAFAYFGSVQEPGLEAFLTPALFSLRFASGAPWGSVFANDVRPMWKIGSLGDPLYMNDTPFGKEPDRSAGDTGLNKPETPLTALNDQMREALKAQDLAGAMRILAMLGRDKDVSDLFNATRKDAPAKVTPALCAAAIASCARSQNYTGVTSAFDGLSAEMKKNGAFRDMLWFAAGDSAVVPNSVTLGLLRENLRPEQIARDAGELGQVWSRVYNKGAAVQMLEQVRDKAPDAESKIQIEAAIKTLK